ncbi:MAG: exodeoxyribonuclease VII large subunit [Oscillospiraceae bacterium]|nr:exodeoxyribonuclease VII large subunit [Oscillospiraceae bacterium]MDY3217743.1 exodeoxyribonuclease VII large subunit [Candidatus Fimivivens sp.]SFJ06681.1 Exodeoxyribonuclease VII large subunit [Ruminococcaceae bacterium D5]
MAVSILKVSQLNRYVRSQLESDRRLSELYVAGEIGSMTVNQRSGHLYFTLKDPNASVRAVMFASHAEHLRFLPKPGLAVIARGAATLYERDGAFQMTVSELMLDGAGALGLAFEQLKEKLAAQGLFSEDRKRPIPPNPRIIGIVTSPSGAALHDIVSVAQRRNPSVLLLLAPAAVQGREASASIAEAIRLLNQDGRSEVILVGRGGGSAEDLWAFNEEEAVRAVASSGIPVISAVGHETDVSLCDYAADLRAATPTAAAELAIPDRTVLLQALERRSELLRERMNRLLAEKQRKLSSLQQMPALHDPAFFLNKNRQRLDYLIESMYDLSRREIPRRSEQLGHRAALLESLSPLGILSRGYAIAERGGRPILSADELSHGEELCLRLHRGMAAVRVERVDLSHGEEKHDL